MNLLPLPLAVKQLEKAAQEYNNRMRDFADVPGRKRWQDVELAYSKLAAAHWEAMILVKNLPTE